MKLRIDKHNLLISGLLFLVSLSFFFSNISYASAAVEARQYSAPGYYQFTDIGKDLPICQDMLKLINEEVEKYRWVRFEDNPHLVFGYEAHPIFIQGEEEKNVELSVQEHIDHMGGGVGKIYRYHIDNDGKKETLYKVKSYRSSAFTDLFYIYEPGNNPAEFEDGINYKELYEHADLDIFTAGSQRWRSDPYKWSHSSPVFRGVVGIYPFEYNDHRYIAMNGPFFNSLPFKINKFYVGEILPNKAGYERIHDLCYFNYTNGNMEQGE